MYAQMRCDFRYQITPAFTHMIAGTQVMHTAKSALDRIDAAAIGRQKNRLKRGSCAKHRSTLACAAPAIGPGDILVDESLMPRQTRLQEVLPALRPVTRHSRGTPGCLPV
jgi:hypothetical protein